MSRPRTEDPMIRMRSSSRLALALLIGLAVTSRAFATGSTSPGKTAVHVSASRVPFCSGSLISLSGTIAKGKKKQVLTIDGMALVVSAASTTNSLLLQVTVNGVSPEPRDDLVDGRDCVHCGLTGHW